MNREQKKLNKKISKKCQTFLVFSLGLVVILSIVRMVVYNRTSTLGRKLEKIEQQTLEIKNQNLRLKSALAQKTGGLEQISKQAEKQGFTNEINIKYFDGSISVAQKLP
ncbi:hypothetical protein ACFL18_01620 [Patescibacteria group bacterium]